MPGGFASPSILYLNSWNRVERDFMQALVSRLHRTGGFKCPVEPNAGAFVMSGVFRAAGFPAEAIQASDVNPFSAIVGTCLTNGDLSELGFAFDGNLVPLEGDPVKDAALLLYKQLLTRIEAKPPVHYWREMMVDLIWREKDHIGKLEHYLTLLRKRFEPGITFTLESVWDLMRRVSGDEQALIVINPPSYAGAYEKFFDTRGRMEWNAPEYEIWTPPRDLPRLVEESKGWAATLLCLHLAEHGNCVHLDPIYAHDKRRGANDYIWSNHPDLIRRTMNGSSSRVRSIPDSEKLENPIIPMDHEITADSVVSVRKITSKQSRYYKDLWIHRQDPSRASCEFVIFIDGLIAGMAGFSEIPLGDEEGSLSMLYCVGPAHGVWRLTRLVKMMALTRCVLESVMNPWFVVTAERVLTKNWTKHPEAKGQRGLMKLVKKETHEQFGYVLTYAAPIKSRTIEETYAEWFKKELAWQKNTTKLTLSIDGQQIAEATKR